MRSIPVFNYGDQALRDLFGSIVEVRTIYNETLAVGTLRGIQWKQVTKPTVRYRSENNYPAWVLIFDGFEQEVNFQYGIVFSVIEGSDDAT